MRASLKVLVASSRRLAVQNVPRVYRPDFGQGQLRRELDQPATTYQWSEKLYGLTHHEREEFDNAPYIGVNHLYEAYQGSKEKPVLVEQPGPWGWDCVVGCLGGCHPDVTTAHGLIYSYVPSNALVVCADCGLHLARRNTTP
eukprot:TRINITY_DN9565_c0_g1_i1.p1 TRINITY_DN9565_c0_g1~~TRINITY_DN9565_c0_g1_i1.p1  ORF type:complete len:142 (-),score=12.27 TRINITY_DN9565_c0_g1_i1:84-509(-)